MPIRLSDAGFQCIISSALWRSRPVLLPCLSLWSFAAPISWPATRLQQSAHMFNHGTCQPGTLGLASAILTWHGCSLTPADSCRRGPFVSTVRIQSAGFLAGPGITLGIPRAYTALQIRPRGRHDTQEPVRHGQSGRKSSLIQRVNSPEPGISAPQAVKPTTSNSNASKGWSQPLGPALEQGRWRFYLG